MSGPDPSLLRIFASEQAELVARMRGIAGQLGAGPPEETASSIEELLRRAHTLKGAARAVGLPETERAVHRLEGELAPFRAAGSAVTRSTGEVIGRVLDYVEDVLAWALGQRGKPDESNVLRALEGIRGSREPARPGPTPASVERPAPESAAPAGDLVRMDAATLDAILRLSSQIASGDSDNQPDTGPLRELAHSAEEAVRTYQALRGPAAAYLHRHREDSEVAAVWETLTFFDERLPSLAGELRRMAMRRQREAWAVHQQLERLHEIAAGARTSSAGEVLGGLGPMVRAVAEQQGKLAQFDAEGLEARADREVLQALRDPVIHLLRNAVSHGLEAPAARAAAGKPKDGTVRLAVHSKGDRLHLIIEDDGSGIDLPALAREAGRRGLSTGGSDADLVKLAFHPGVSTATTISEISGRGLGLSIVKAAVTRLRGEVSIRSQAGRGTAVQISVPVSASAQHVLLLEEAGHDFAIPAASIDGVARRLQSEIIPVDARPSVLYAGHPVPVVRLRELAGIQAAATQEIGSSTERPTLSVVIVNTHAGRVAIAVDKVSDYRYALVRETGLPAAKAGLATGAIPLEDGRVAVLLGVADALERVLASGMVASGFETMQPERRRAMVLVVDDSITTRSVERSILEAHGYEVELAVDGVEALERIRSRRPDLVISDVAMPRMDGFTLLEKLKTGKDTAQIPVILVTSLESPEEQERGLSLGADAYIVKRKFDQRELLATVRQIL